MFMALHWANLSRTNPLLHWTDTALQICPTRAELKGRIPKAESRAVSNLYVYKGSFFPGAQLGIFFG